jgi:hypothetical protein
VYVHPKIDTPHYHYGLQPSDIFFLGKDERYLDEKGRKYVHLFHNKKDAVLETLRVIQKIYLAPLYAVYPPYMIF